MNFEQEYQLEQFREVQDQYFDEDGKCYNRHILSTDIAEKMLNLIDKLSERVNALEPVIEQQIKKSLPIHGVVRCTGCDSANTKAIVGKVTYVCNDCDKVFPV